MEISLNLSFFPKFKLNFLICLILKFGFILDCLISTLRTFWAQFEVLGVKSKHFSKIWQICLICQINLRKTKLPLYCYNVEIIHQLPRNHIDFKVCLYLFSCEQITGFEFFGNSNLPNLSKFPKLTNPSKIKNYLNVLKFKFKNCISFGIFWAVWSTWCKIRQISHGILEKLNYTLGTNYNLNLVSKYFDHKSPQLSKYIHSFNRVFFLIQFNKLSNF